METTAAIDALAINIRSIDMYMILNDKINIGNSNNNNNNNANKNVNKQTDSCIFKKKKVPFYRSTNGAKTNTINSYSIERIVTINRC